MRFVNMTEDQLPKLDPKKTVAILPVGICCNHGEWLPLGIDAFLAEKMAGEMEKKIGYLKDIATIILPTQFLFVGVDGLSLSNLWESEFNFRKILIVNGSIGEDYHIDQAIEKIKGPQTSNPVKISNPVTRIFRTNTHIQQLLADHFDVSFTHGNAVELSMVSAIDRNRIRIKIGSNMPEIQNTIGGIIINEIAIGLMEAIERMMTPD